MTLKRGVRLIRDDGRGKAASLAEAFQMTVDVAAVADPHNDHQELVVFNQVDDSVVADPQLEQPVKALHRCVAVRPGVDGEPLHHGDDSALVLLREALDLAPGGWGDPNDVARG